MPFQSVLAPLCLFLSICYAEDDLFFFFSVVMGSHVDFNIWCDSQISRWFGKHVKNLSGWALYLRRSILTCRLSYSKTDNGHMMMSDGSAKRDCLAFLCVKGQNFTSVHCFSWISTIMRPVDDSCHCGIMGSATWRMTFWAMCHLIMLPGGRLSIACLNVCVPKLQWKGREQERASNFLESRKQTQSQTHTHYPSFFGSIWQVFSLKESFQTVGIKATQGERWQHEDRQNIKPPCGKNNPSAAQEKVYFSKDLWIYISDFRAWIFCLFLSKEQGEAVKTDVFWVFLGC